MYGHWGRGLTCRLSISCSVVNFTVALFLKIKARINIYFKTRYNRFFQLITVSYKLGNPCIVLTQNNIPEALPHCLGTADQGNNAE